MNTQSTVKPLQWDEKELQSAVNTDKEIPTITRANFGNQIDQANSLIRSMIDNILIQYGAEATGLTAELLDALETGAFLFARKNCTFKTDYTGEVEYISIDNIGIADVHAVEATDRIKITWQTTTDKPYLTDRSSYTVEEDLQAISNVGSYVADNGGDSIVNVKLVDRSSIGFVVAITELHEHGVDAMDFFDLEELSKAEAEADHSAPIDWLRHGGYRALKMFIS